MDLFLMVGGRQVPLRLVRNLRARRYVLRLRPDGAARVTIPQGGSAGAAHDFAKRNLSWLEQQLLRQAARPNHPRQWLIGTEILFRGELAKPEADVNSAGNHIRFAGESLKVADVTSDLRPAIERYLRRRAAGELPPRVLELAAQQQLTVRRVTVRNQRSRWGSCSRRGRISLNWRLIQTPDFVRDYILLHELMHLREMNHSPRFWREVKRVCPNYETAERWLKQNASLLK